MRKALTLAATSALTLVSLNGHAMSFGTFDPRSMAMGGTGVASGTGANASYYNPALLAVAHDENDFDLVLPTIGVRAADPGSIADGLQDFQDTYIQSLEDTINAYNSATSVAELQAAAADAAQAARDLEAELVSFSGDPLIVDANVGIALAIPNQVLGLALYANGRAVGGGELNVRDEDIATADAYIAELESVAAGNPPDLSNPALYDNGVLIDPTDDLQSTADGRGAVITETGLSLANEFDALAGVAIGVTPKYVRVDTFDYHLDVETGDFDLAENRKAYSDFNFDLGIAKKLAGGWKLGLVGKYLVAQEYKTFLGNTVNLDPQVRAGVAWETDILTIAADLDLTKNPPLGLDDETQHFGAGIEYDLLDTFQLRAGLKHNLAGDDGVDPTTLSAGFGFTFGVRMDFAVAGNSDELSAGFLLGASF